MLRDASSVNVVHGSLGLKTKTKTKQKRNNVALSERKLISLKITMLTSNCVNFHGNIFERKSFFLGKKKDSVEVVQQILGLKSIVVGKDVKGFFHKVLSNSSSSVIDSISECSLSFEETCL